MKKIEYKGHLFICTNHRENKDSCAAKNSEELYNELKSWLKKNPDLKKQLRVTRTGCLGECSNGIACVLYPKQDWKLNTDKKDAESLKKELLSLIKST